MADKSFGIKEINLIGASGTPRIDSPNNLNINAINVAISTNVSAGGIITANAGFSTSAGAGTLMFRVDGTKLVFNVVGIGSTSLTLS